MIVLETLARRWYAFAFLAFFFWSARAERSWARALRFLLVASVASFAAEWSSTRTGFPYGRYAYIAPTHGKELYLSNVPLFVPLTFGVVVWAGRALAARRGGRVRLVLGGALAAAAIDLVIDPVTARGGAWFLGPLYAYAHGGGWFGVPWTNLGGWVLTAGLILAMDEALEQASPPALDARPSLRGEALAAAICAFFVVLAFAIGRPEIGGASIGVVAALLWLARAA